MTGHFSSTREKYNFWYKSQTIWHITVKYKFLDLGSSRDFFVVNLIYW